MRILVIEDNIKLAESLTKGLKQEGYVAEHINDGLLGMKRVTSRHQDYDLLILDISLPGMDGFSICREMRKNGIHMPVIMLTAHDTTQDKIQGLDGGADDYMVKPFSFEELLSRVRALSRRPQTSFHNPEMVVGNIVMKLSAQEVYKGKKKIDLTLKEFRILEFFMKHPDQVLSRQTIVDNLWDFDFNPLSRTMDVHINNLRNKLNIDHESTIETVRGVGYRLRA